MQNTIESGQNQSKQAAGGGRRWQRRRTSLVPREPEVVLVPASNSQNTGEEVIHVDENSDVLEPQAILFINDINRRERLAFELSKLSFRTVQVDDLVTAYAVVTRLIPELIVVDPTLCFEENWRDLTALRKFTTEQDCAMMVLLGDPCPEMVKRLADLGVDQISLCTDPLSVLAFTIYRVVLDKREIRKLKEHSAA